MNKALDNLLDLALEWASRGQAGPEVNAEMVDLHEEADPILYLAGADICIVVVYIPLTVSGSGIWRLFRGKADYTIYESNKDEAAMSLARRCARSTKILHAFFVTPEQIVKYWGRKEGEFNEIGDISL